MPNPLVVYPERRREHDADTLQGVAEGYERFADSGIDEAYRRAADEWKSIAESYSGKSRSERYEQDRLYYRCRAGLAWLAAARNYAKAAEYADKHHADDYRTKSVRAYREAARMFEGCGTDHAERGALVEARGDFEQAQVCYERCGDDAAAARVGRLAARIADGIESGTLKED